MSTVLEKIPLSEMLAELRKELLLTKWAGLASDLKFQIEDIEIELQIATTKAEGAGAGIKFWVLNADAKTDSSEAKTQKLKLKLKPVGRNGKPFNVADEDE
jgi:hypothetical protein